MKIVVTESEDFSEAALAELSRIGEVVLLDVQERDHLINSIKDADVLFVRLRFFIDQIIIDSCPNLKVILTATTGLDHIDLDYFESRGGKVISLRGAYDFLNTIPSTAEHTWGLLLSLVRSLPAAFEDVKNGFWRRDFFKGNNLKSKRIGILGLGRVGFQVAGYAAAFGMEVGFYDVLDKSNHYRPFATPEDLFAWADIISIHIPLHDANRHFIGKALLDCLGADSVLINTSRGAVIDESYLCELIAQKRIKGYATDVIENELAADLNQNTLINLSKKGFNVIVTPHIAGATYESMAMTEEFIVKEFVALLDS